MTPPPDRASYRVGALLHQWPYAVEGDVRPGHLLAGDPRLGRRRAVVADTPTSVRPAVRPDVTRGERGVHDDEPGRDDDIDESVVADLLLERFRDIGEQSGLAQVRTAGGRSG